MVESLTTNICFQTIEHSKLLHQLWIYHHCFCLHSTLMIASRICDSEGSIKSV